MAYSLPVEPVRQDVRFFPSEEKSMPVHPAQVAQTDQKKQEFNILEKLKQLRDERKYCDIILDVKGSKLEAHKNVLAAWSPYFALKLFPDDQLVYKDTVVVNYDNSEVFADLLDFMYNGYVAPRETNFLELLHLAVSFQIETLKNYCEEFLRCNLHLGNFMSTYFLSRKYRLEGLEEFIVGFLQMNLSDAVKQSEFLTLTAAKFNTFLSKGLMEQIKPEIKLFLIISWVGYDVQERECFLVLLLGHIDWSTVASDFLLEINRTENFFTSHESSLYLLLQTLFSAGIPLGPYTEVFPTLRQTHSHLLTQVVHTSLLPTEVDDYFQVTISVNNRPYKRSVSSNTTLSSLVPLISTGVNTDVNNQHFKEHEQVGSSEAAGATKDVERETAVDEPGCGEVEEKSTENEKKKRKRRLRPRKVQESPPEEVSNEVEETAKEAKVLRNTRSRAVTRSASEVEESEKIDSDNDVKLEGVKPEQAPNLYPDVETEKDSNALELLPDKEDGYMDEEKMLPEVEEDEELGEEECDEDKDQEEEEEDEEEEDEEDLDLKQEAVNGDSEISRTRSKQARALNSTKRKGRRPSKKRLFCKVDDCEYSTMVASRMQKHDVRLHQSKARLTCNLCNYDTQVTRTFHRHMKTHFPGPPFKCDEPCCRYSTDRITKLVIHRLSHSGERPYGCEQCGMRFRSANNLWAHAKVHVGARPFECEVCHRMFAMKNTLNQHMVTHSDHRPYLCDTCGFATKYQSHLIAHKRKHTGEVYHCQFPKCTYSTPKRSQLKAHMRSHLGIRSHVCQTCGKSFIERSHLVRHEKLHMDSKPYECSECEYSSTRHDKLKEHIVKHHSTSSPKEKKVRRSYKRAKASPQNNSVNPTDITAPMLVKWDHGSYSMQQPNEGLIPVDQYCVLREQLTSSQGLEVGPDGMGIDQRVMSLASTHLGQQPRLTELQGVVAEMGQPDHTGVLQQVNAAALNIVGSPQHLDSGEVTHTTVTSGTDGSTETHTYTIIPPPTSVSESNLAQASQPEYGGLNAFMSLF